MATKAKPAPRKKVNAPKASRSASKGAPKAAQKRPAVKKPAPKKAPAKKNAAKKPAARKPVAKQAAPKKAAARKPVTKKAAAKKPAAKKPAAKQAVTKKLSATKAPARKPAPKAAPAVSAKSGKSPRAFRPEELASFRAMLQKQLELVQGNLNALANDNLKRSPLESTGDISSHSTHMADHGTDNFDRELALSLASSRQDSLYDIEDAIRRIDEGEYGSCELCGNPIERPRLKALPFAKKCLACQSASERGRGRFQPFRSSSHVPANAPDDTPEPSDS